MKKLLSVIFVFIFLFSLLPQVVSAADIELYNHNEVVSLAYPIEVYADTPYIELSDIGELGLECENDGETVKVLDWETGELWIYKDSNYISFNSNSMLYRNAIRKFNDIEYISLDLIAMCFSAEYSFSNDIIELYTLSDEYWAVNGRVSLPDGDVAEEDIKVTVFIGNAVTASNSGGGGSVAGYDGEPKPTYTDTTKRYNYRVYDKLTILQGKSYVDFVLKGSKQQFQNSKYIGYSISAQGYQSKFARGFYYSSGHFEDLTVQNKSDTLVCGTVTLPETAEEDEEFQIAAIYENEIYTAKGIVVKGEKVGYYSIDVACWYSYDFAVTFSSGRYQRQTLTDKIYISDINAPDVDFTAERSKAIDVELLLPEGVYTGDATATVTLQSAKEPHYWLSEQTVSLYEPTVTLYDDMNCDNYICYYTLDDEVDGLYDYGHYGIYGTTANVEYAKSFTSAEDSISIPLLKEKAVSVTVKLPDGEIAQEDIAGKVNAIAVEKPIDSNFAVVDTYKPDEELEQANTLEVLNNTTSDKIYTNKNTATAEDLMGDIFREAVTIDDVQDRIESYTVSGTSYGVSDSSVSSGTSVTPALSLIKAGQNQAIHTIAFPDEQNFNYELMIINNYKSGQTQYYSNNNSTNSTFFKDKADYITSDSVEITLMPQNIISGTFTTDLTYFAASLVAYAVLDNGKTERIKIADLNYDTGRYTVYVPKEATNYLLAVESSIMHYYKDGKTVPEIKDAEILKITEDTTVDICYVSYNPTLAVRVSTPDDVYESVETKGIKLKNISDYDKSDLTFYAISYDINDRMTDIYRKDIKVIEKGETYIIYPDELSYQLNNNYKTKLFVWSDRLTPSSEVKIINYPKNTLITRLELADMLTELYEKQTGTKIQITEDFAYLDTTEQSPLKLHQLGLMNGYPDNTFCPEGHLTHSEMITVLNRMFKLLGYSFELPAGFVSQYDIDISHWVYNILIEMEGTGILYELYPDKFPKDEYISKEEAKRLTMAYFELLNG